jgi:F-type H+-transporting ATPase subunit c
MKKVILAVATLILSVPALAQQAAAVAAPTAGSVLGSAGGLIAIAAGLAIGLAALGGTIAQSRVAAAALEGTARNPAASNKFAAPLFVGLALIESLVLLAFVIAIQLINQNGSLLTSLLGK